VNRYFLEIAYDGTNYHGWQIQDNANTVQEELNKAIAILSGLKKINSMGCGRTDSGVHASEFFLHFDVDDKLDEERFSYKLNQLLPTDIAVKRMFGVHAEAHTRFDATSRTYEYHIHQLKNPFLGNRSYFFKRSLDLHLMNKAAQLLLNYNDFSSFSKSGTDTSTNNCIIKIANWHSRDDQLIFTIKADRFLRNMVRAITGTMLEVGEGKLGIKDLAEIIEQKDRSAAGGSVPAHGLYLTKIEYPYNVKSK